MKLSHLLAKRPDLLREVRLANLGFAYQALCLFAGRVARANLRGRVRLVPIDPHAERFFPGLTALESNQSLIEEHFSDEDLILLADVVGFATGHPGFEFTFRIDDLSEFIEPLRAELLRAGISLDAPTGALTQQAKES